MQGKLFAAAGLFAAFVGGQAFAQTSIANSPHDLSSGSAANEDKNEVCVYCHTPHAARTGLEAPLWNKPESTAPGGYTTYDSTTIDGTVIAVGSVSIACLTCHDGTQSVDAVINAPGTGLGDGNILAAPSLITGAANIGETGGDLSNDHPIGIQYGGYAPGGTQIDPDFENAAGNLADNGQTGAAARWWVDTSVGTANQRDKTDMILYTRQNGANFEPFVECASCHDPHVGATADAGTNLDGSDISFMRISNENSDVCLACHVK